MRPLPHFVQSPLLRSVPGIFHAFLGKDPVAGRGTRDLLREVFSVPPESVGTLRQVHSSAVLSFEPDRGELPGGPNREGDALWTSAPCAGTGVYTADCVPILLAHREMPLVAAVHAGWRGLAAGIVEETVRTVARTFGSPAVEGIVAVAGPCARGCCYEVGGEASEALRRLPGGPEHLRRGREPGKWMADLQGIACSLLRDSGVSPGRVDAVGPCTICSDRYHSFRREKSLTARQLSFIYICESP